MKKKCVLAIFVFTLIACLFCAACAKDVKTVGIAVRDAAEGETLKTYMDKMEERGEISYTIENGMVTSVNGIANAANSYWMLYTDDVENSDESWGVLEYDGKTCFSAKLGAEALHVKNGCVYVWSYESF